MRLLFWLAISGWLLQPVHAQELHELVPPSSSDHEADNACAMISAYAEMGVADAPVKALASTCARDPNPHIVCGTMLIFKLSHRANPGLVCSDPDYQRAIDGAN